MVCCEVHNWICTVNGLWEFWSIEEAVARRRSQALHIYHLRDISHGMLPPQQPPKCLEFQTNEPTNRYRIPNREKVRKPCIFEIGGCQGEKRKNFISNADRK